MHKNTEIFTTSTGSMCRSYNVIIAKIDNGRVYLDGRYYNYSMTTRKHRAAYLGECIAETCKKTASGEYILANLN